jgi:hypothetical protein
MQVPIKDLKSGNVVHYAGVRATVIAEPTPMSGSSIPSQAGRKLLIMQTSMGEFIVPEEGKIELVATSGLTGA